MVYKKHNTLSNSSSVFLKTNKSWNKCDNFLYLNRSNKKSFWVSFLGNYILHFIVAFTSPKKSLIIVETHIHQRGAEKITFQSYYFKVFRSYNFFYDESLHFNDFILQYFLFEILKLNTHRLWTSYSVYHIRLSSCRLYSAALPMQRELRS